MGRSANDRARAFSLYCQGVPYDKIALVVGCGSRTIPRWIDKYGWREDKEKLALVVKESGKNDKGTLNLELLKSIKTVWAKSVQNGDAKASAGDLIKAMTFERLMEGESTENVSIVKELTLEERYKAYLDKKDSEVEE